MVEEPMRQLVEQLAGAMQQYTVLQFRDDYPGEPGPPSTEAELATVRADLGRPLPPSYEAFLRLHNGWTDFIGEAPLLRAQDRHEPWFARRLARVRAHLTEFDMAGLPEHAFLVVLHPDVSTLVYIDTSGPTRDGEFETVEYDIREDEQERHPSFRALLESRLEFFTTEVNQLRRRSTGRPR
jgi:hypothetical protein